MELQSGESNMTSRRGYLLATASGVAAAAATGGVQAADMGLPLKAPAPPPPAASWAGWYIGLNAGAAWQHAANESSVGGSKLDYVSPTTSATGFIGGGQIGYNWQDGNFVFGLEGDIDGLTGKGHTLQFGHDDFGGIVPPPKSFSNKISWLSTVRARTGLAVGDTMAYVTGGLAIGGVKDSMNVAFTGLGFTPKSVSQTRVGWVIGGGVEHMLWNSHWTVGLEALFVDLGTSTVTVNPAFTGPLGKTGRFSNQAVIGRLKVNYKF